MKKLFLTLAMVLVAVGAYAYDVKVDEIYYNLNKEEKTAEVTKSYRGYLYDIIIPEQYITSINSVTIPNSATSIGKGAFEYCKYLTSVNILKSVINIGEDAFAWCSSLLDVYCYAENVPETSEYAFYGTEWNGAGIAVAVLHVPAVTLEDYKATDPWSRFGSIVPLTDEEMAVKAPVKYDNAPAAIFDTQGRRLAQPQKGLNIINGRKVIR